MTAPTMLAVHVAAYGGPENASVQPIPAPVASELKSDQALIRVHYAAFNQADRHLLMGKPRAARLVFGMFKPTYKALGNDYAGVVEAVGSAVKSVVVGDCVFGEVVTGAFAELVVAKEGSFAKLPAGVTTQQAVALPCAGVTALQAARDAGKVSSATPKVLVNGASGGVGHYCMQIAKILGATHVTAVCSGKNAELVRSLGADKVVDYTKEDCTVLAEGEAKYDVVLDVAGSKPFAEFRKAMTPTGRYVSIGGPGEGVLGAAWDGMTAVMSSSFSKQKAVMIGANINTKELDLLGQWVAEAKLKPHVSKVVGDFTTDAVRSALAEIVSGRAVGKIVLALPASKAAPVS